MELAGGELVELDEIGRLFPDRAEDPPDGIFRNDVLHAVENDLCLDPVMVQKRLHVDKGHVAGPYFEVIQARSYILAVIYLHPVGVIRPDNGGEDVLLVYDIAAQDAVDDIGRDNVQTAREEESRSRDGPSFTVHLFIADQEGFESKGFKALEETFLSLGPDEHDRQGKGGNDQGPVGAVGDLVEGGHQVEKIDDGDSGGNGNLPLGLMIEDHSHGNPRDGHGTRHRHSVGGGKIRRLLEDKHHQQDAQHKDPVHSADVDLGLHGRRGKADLHQGHDQGRDRLIDHGKDAADHGLGGDDRGNNGQDEKGDVEPGGLVMDHAEDHYLCLRVLQGEDPLAEIVDHQGDADKIPGVDDWFAAEVSHVCVEGFSSRSTEDYLGEDKEARHPVVGEKLDRVPGTYSLDDLGHGKKGGESRGGKGNKPDEHDRTESPGDSVCSARLEQKEEHGDAHGNGE